TFGTDPDLPGGTLEDNETLLEAMVREVAEEVGFSIDGALAQELYVGTEYSSHGTLYALFVATFEERPEIVMSWEHSSYEWLEREEFLERAKNANDTFMHMVHDVLKTNH